MASCQNSASLNKNLTEYGNKQNSPGDKAPILLQNLTIIQALTDIEAHFKDLNLH